ncbi:hypothetical protein GDO86_010591 [Hymenochirus boettgeri]|uniref:XK-related protein n=1 Tax=Hymenochirus boettgeri TaxID=247094 RepID=A0A8T2JQ05_9PIPI|nr:hypothetical protein GDO86_010591 [Hymenochirus boettgeri]
METAGSSVGFAVVSLMLYLAERGAVLTVVLHYFLKDQYMWAGCTLAAFVPGCFIQALSFAWFRRDEHPGCFTLTLIHVLQLGILKRHVECLQVAKRGREEQQGEARAMLMQQGDLALLQVAEGLLLALPHLLLQTFIYLTLDYTSVYAVVSALLSLLMLSWSLVSYSRFLCLLKPGHLSMPWASLICLLLWRMGMIGTRAMTLAVFARVYHFWVFAVGGVHWLVMSFWLVSQQTDVLSKTSHWKMFNALVGAVYIFCYLNVKDGRSRYRATAFYVFMLLENVILLLLATDFLQRVLWSNIKLSVAVMSGLLIGCCALVIYYTLLHPKSTEISQSFRKMAHVVKGGREKTEDSLSPGSGRETIERDMCDHQKVRTRIKETMITNEWLVDWLGQTSQDHHWLLLKLAMKTGNASKITAAFSGDDFGVTFSPEGPAQPKDELQSPGHTCEQSSYVTLGNTRVEDDKGDRAAEEVKTKGMSSTKEDGFENGTMYFSANTEGILHATKEIETEPKKPEVGLGEDIHTPVKEIPVQEEAFPVICVSPILNLATNSNFQRSVIHDMGSLCNESGLSNDDSAMETVDLFEEKNHLLTVGLVPHPIRGRLIQEEKPCFTSTPKPQATVMELGKREETKTKRKLLEEKI